MDDDALIIRYLDARDDTAFAELVARYRPFMRRVLFGVFGCWCDEAEEAEQEVLIALSGELSKFRGKATFGTYLYRMVRNKGVDALRRLRRRRKHLAPVGSEICDPGNPEAAAIDRERRRLLYRILGHLKEEQRSLLILKEIEGYSLTDIAELTGLPVGTLKSRLHRARRRAARLAEQAEGGEYGM